MHANQPTAASVWRETGPGKTIHGFPFALFFTASMLRSRLWGGQSMTDSVWLYVFLFRHAFPPALAVWLGSLSCWTPLLSTKFQLLLHGGGKSGTFLRSYLHQFWNAPWHSLHHVSQTAVQTHCCTPWDVLTLIFSPVVCNLASYFLIQLN